MVGLFENIGLAIEGAYVKARCDVANQIVDVRLRHKLRKYEKMRQDSGEELEDEEENKESEKLETPENPGGTCVGVMAKKFTGTLVTKPKHKRIITERRNTHGGSIGN